MDKKQQLYLWLAGIFVTALIVGDLIGGRFFHVAGVDLSAWEILGGPALVGAVAWLVHRLQFRKAPVAAWARTS